MSPGQGDEIVLGGVDPRMVAADAMDSWAENNDELSDDFFGGLDAFLSADAGEIIETTHERVGRNASESDDNPYSATQV